MEAMEIFLSATRDLSYVILYHPVYSAFGVFVLVACLLRFYFRLTVGICNCDEDMTGKTVLITGASAGIGKATAKDMARRNARVILACRNLDKAHRVANEIISSTGNSNVVVKQLDLASFNSVRKCAQDVLNTEEKLHVLINNAGTYASDKKTTEDNCEIILQSNHFGHFLLTLLLLDLLKKSSPSRVINVSSDTYILGKLDFHDVHGKSCKHPLDLYSRSKLANILFTRELAKRLAGTGVTVNSLHPGMTKTDLVFQADGFLGFLAKYTFKFLGKSCEEGAQTTIYLAVHPDLEKTTGKYFSNCKEEKVVGRALSERLAEEFFDASEKIVGISMQKA